MELQEEVLAFTANFVALAFIDLTDCLKKNGALLPGQFENALRETLEHGSADRDRLDYGMLSNLLKMVERCQPKLH